MPSENASAHSFLRLNEYSKSKNESDYTG
uniref:Uncharacterized protein n=1 Tax=Anguilla anguilla TaxID=7936 RepID=A0A0E9VUS7_ANGAN